MPWCTTCDHWVERVEETCSKCGTGRPDTGWSVKPPWKMSHAARTTTPPDEKQMPGASPPASLRDRLVGWLVVGLFLSVSFAFAGWVVVSDREDADRLKSDLRDMGFEVRDLSVSTPGGYSFVLGTPEVEVFLTGARSEALQVCRALEIRGWPKATVYPGQALRRWDRSRGVEC